MAPTQSMAAPGAQLSEVGEQLRGKYLTFKVGSEEFGMRILKVSQIIQLQQITRVPRTPDYVRGVINLRGKVIPVIELRRKFGMELRGDDEKTCIVVVAVQGPSGEITMGVVIDEVREVLEIAADAIEETPAFGDSAANEFIIGMAKVGETVKMLLDIDRVLSATELIQLQEIQ